MRWRNRDSILGTFFASNFAFASAQATYSGDKIPIASTLLLDPSSLNYLGMFLGVWFLYCNFPPKDWGWLSVWQVPSTFYGLSLLVYFQVGRIHTFAELSTLGEILPFVRPSSRRSSNVDSHPEPENLWMLLARLSFIFHTSIA